MGYTEQEKIKSQELVDEMMKIVKSPGMMTRKDADRFDVLERQFWTLRRKRGDEEAQPSLMKFDLQKMSDYQKERVEKLALCEFIRTGSLQEDLRPLMMPQDGKRTAQQSTTNGSGGYTIPTGMTFDLERALKYHGGMWENARIIRTDRGNTTAWGYTNDTENPAYIIGEATDGTTSATAVTFGSKQFTGYKYTSGVMQVSNEVLIDSELFAQEFTNVLAERIFMATNTHFTTGDGTNKPTGAATSAIYGVSTTADGDIASADILNLIYSVNTSYRRNGKLMMHSSTLKAIQGKADSTSEEKPFWVPPLQSGGDPAGSVWGYPVVINDDLSSFVGAGTSADDDKKAILFGDFQKYIIRQARDLRIVRLPQRFADLDQTAIVVFMRVDGDIINAGTNPIKYLRVSTT